MNSSVYCLELFRQKNADDDEINVNEIPRESAIKIYAFRRRKKII